MWLSVLETHVAINRSHACRWQQMTCARHVIVGPHHLESHLAHTRAI